MSFRVTTYNVLAAAYARERLYPRTPQHLLDATYRRSLLPPYVLRLDADILCLQEVEAETFVILERELSLAGFVAAFAAKGNGKPDGCAVLVRSERAAWMKNAHLAYHDGKADGGTSSGHIAQIVSLRVEDHVLAVANTHLKWDRPGRPRDEQVGVRQIEELIAARSQLVPDADGWIVAGDFNVTADGAPVATLQSAGFQFSHVNATAPTCVANGEARMIDYIFADRALTASPLPIPPITEEMPLPGVGEPSDHVPISAMFRWSIS